MKFLFFRRRAELVPIHEPPPPAPTENPVTRHEPNDIKIRSVAWVAGAFVMALALTFGGAWGVWRLSEAHVTNNRGPLPPPMRVQLAPPMPRLQADVGADEDALRARQLGELNSYGWVDRAHGQARIPINRAMDLVAGGENGRKAR